MEQADTFFARCTAIARLTIGEMQPAPKEKTATALAEQALRYLSPTSSDSEIRTVLLNIQRDAALVEALRCAHHREHRQAWATWLGQAQAILRRAGLDWCHDCTIDVEDLAQIALLQLSRSLPNYRYASRFSTWAYQVITRAVQRHLRDMATQKRKHQIDYESDLKELTVPISEAERPEAQVCERALGALVDTMLTSALGSRNATVFRLWAQDDLSAPMISKQMGLSQARVHAIIAQARSHLQSHPAIQCWRER